MFEKKNTMLLAAPVVTIAQTTSVGPQTITPAKSTPSKTGRAIANGVSYYYEIHGKGEPLLLLHGGLGSIDMFGPLVLPALAKGRQVIAVDLHGHGRTPLCCRSSMGRTELHHGPPG